MRDACKPNDNLNVSQNRTSSQRLKPDFSINKAHNAQLALSKRIDFTDKISKYPNSVAGIDVAYTNGLSIAAVAVLDYDNLRLQEVKTTVFETNFPYIPTLLSFRELTPAMQCIRKLETNPDAFLVDGHGYAHPFRCGFACHLGLALKKPTIGVAKSILVGKVDENKSAEVAFLRHPDEIIGVEIRSKSQFKPIYVSVGNMISLQTAIEIVRHCTSTNRLPQPLILAHRAANAAKRKVNMLARRKSEFER